MMLMKCVLSTRLLMFRHAAVHPKCRVVAVQHKVQQVILETNVVLGEAPLYAAASTVPVCRVRCSLTVPRSWL